MKDDSSDSFYSADQPSISEIWQIQKPEGRFNDWGERKWITSTVEELETIDRDLATLQLSSRAHWLLRAARITNSLGIEFVLFSDAQFPAPIIYKDSGLHIIPCFRPLSFVHGAATPDRRQSAMMKRGKFVYDGWIPNHDWTPSNLESLVESLDDFVNLFSLVGLYHAHWTPKYEYSGGAVPSHMIIPTDFVSLTNAGFILNNLPPDDKKAISRSAAWIANALRDDSPVQRFLLMFVSIEALVTYIERQAPTESPLHKFAKDRLSKAKRKEKREACITKLLASDLEPTKAVQEAYFRCVVGSKATLKEHLDRIFGSDQVSKIIFTEESGGKSLWQLRNDIAHGSLNILSDQELEIVSSRVGMLEEIARTYLRIILTSLAGVNFFTPPRSPALTFSASQAIGSPGTTYKGPTDMADYYINVDALSSSFIRVHGEAGPSNLQFKL